MEEKEELGLQVVSNKQSGILAVADYDLIKATIDKFVANNRAFCIIDDDDKAKAKKNRAEINKKIAAIDRVRIDSVNDFVSSFEEQCKSLTSPLKELSDAYGKEIKSFEDAKKLVLPVDDGKPKVITATIKYYDAKTTEKLVAFCQNNGCTLKVE